MRVFLHTALTPLLHRRANRNDSEPWKANVSILNTAGVKLGKTYPRPIVDHAVVSKENMNKMKLAYDLHKQNQGGGGKKPASTSGTNLEPPKKKAKKVKKQTKLK